MDACALKDAILEATLPNVLFDGWTDHALRAGAQTAGYGPEMLLHAFPEGAADAVAWFADWADRRMIAAYQAEDTSALGLTARVALAIRLRLGALEPHREAVQSWMAWLALPPHAGLAARVLSGTVDQIWRLAGDRSVDFSYYTKRALLVGVYGAVVLYWLGDESEGQIGTTDFLHRSLKASTGFGRKASAMGGLERLVTLIPSPVRFGRQARRRAAGRG